jgi:hypothetical protein
VDYGLNTRTQRSVSRDASLLLGFQAVVVWMRQTCKMRLWAPHEVASLHVVPLSPAWAELESVVTTVVLEEVRLFFGTLFS